MGIRYATLLPVQGRRAVANSAALELEGGRNRANLNKSEYT